MAFGFIAPTMNGRPWRNFTRGPPSQAVAALCIVLWSYLLLGARSYGHIVSNPDSHKSSAGVSSRDGSPGSKGVFDFYQRFSPDLCSPGETLSGSTPFCSVASPWVYHSSSEQNS